MSSALNYFLAGKYFSRVFSLSEDQKILKNSLQLFRLPEDLHQWYFERNLKGFPEDQVVKISEISHEIISANIKKLSDRFNRTIEYIELDYHQLVDVQKDKLDVKKLNVEKVIQSRKFSNLMKKTTLSTDLLIDTFAYYPVLEEKGVIKDIIQKYIFERISVKQEIVILTGEMIWSGWFSLNTLVDRLNLAGKGQCLIIFDVWGVLQQILSGGGFVEELLKDDKLHTFLEHISLSILVIDKKDKMMGVVNEGNKKTSIHNLFVNKNVEKNYSPEFSHRPDYLYVYGGRGEDERQVPLGLEVNRVKTLPLSILGSRELTLDYPHETLLQKSPGSSVEWREDIGQVPVVEEKLVSIKLHKQVNLTISFGEYANQGDIIGVRAVLKGALREKVISPMGGRVNTKYFGLGLLKFRTKTDTEAFYAPFDGEILSVKKSEGQLRLLVNASCYTVFPAYQIGSRVYGKLVTPKELSSSTEDKILLAKEEHISVVTIESIVKNNIVGIIFVALGYSKLRKLVHRLEEAQITLTVVILNPFSLKEKEEQNEVLFLYTGNMLVIENKQLSLLIQKKELKQIYLRLRSKKEKRFSAGLAKGEEVMIFNYSVQDRYARIEKFSNNKLSLTSKKDFHLTDLRNISKFSITELNAD